MQVQRILEKRVSNEDEQKEESMQAADEDVGFGDLRWFSTKNQ